jgi:hypothetical protein
MKIKTLLLLSAATITLSYVSCKKDDSSSSNSTTSATSTTSTTANPNTPNTLVYEGKAISGVIGNCEFSSEGLGITGSVQSADGVSYVIAVDFESATPSSGTYKTVELPTDPINSTQCHLTMQRTTSAQTLLGMIAPAGADVKLVKNGDSYMVSFGTIKFRAILGGNGTRSASCNGFGCE